MTPDPDALHRLRFLVRVTQREMEHLQTTDHRLFQRPFTAEAVAQLAHQPDLAERVDAFVSRFGRLQDTLGDKLLPELLRALGERVGAAIDNLDRAERLGLLSSADAWMTVRRLRNQMIHAYIEDPVVLADALQTGHESVPLLLDAADRMHAEIRRRGWL
ncbi:hypothetical protein [Thiococcus pfennigii]|uniref:hypothetical protein n=1 Tax=Thiococcus pfennigii TaxID=1057 RepID=UPI0019034466|nr:hypothetical protein [Thiococcus pfennigii]